MPKLQPAKIFIDNNYLGCCKPGLLRILYPPNYKHIFMMRNKFASQHIQSKEFNKGVKKYVKYSVPSNTVFGAVQMRCRYACEPIEENFE